MAKTLLKILVLLTVASAAAFGGWKWWLTQQNDKLPLGIVSANGRIEAIQSDVSTKYPGRIHEVLVKEGDRVEEGQILARMDTLELDAALAKANALVAEAKESLNRVLADIAQAEAAAKFKEQQVERALQLQKQNAVSKEEVEEKQSARDQAIAVVRSGKAVLKTSEAAVTAALAEVAKLQVEIDDCVLKAPVQGRVLYRLAEVGEVVPAGGKILTILDLSDIYMEVFLPSKDATRIKIGSEGRIVVDAAPKFAAIARVSFVAPEAQFTPKMVETSSERDKLMFRVKVQLIPERVEPYLEYVKTGVRGVAYVRIDDSVKWPEKIDQRFPEPSDLQL